MASQRKIIHIDMDAFYASIEQRDFPEYRGKPIAVGGSGERGVVSAASYEARRYGVRSAMSSQLARRKCPPLIFVKGRMKVYREVSREIMNIFYDYTDLVEPLSLDEAFLDVTENKINFPSATLIAKQLKQKIKDKTRLSASAGVSFNKFLAKIASDYDKPDGLYVIEPDIAERFVEQLPIEKFYGIGKVTAKKMHKEGIFKGIDLKQIPERELVRRFGKVGHYYFNISRAIDLREVNPNRIRKSVGAENTFSEDLSDFGQMQQQLSKIAQRVNKRLLRSKRWGYTLTLKIKFSDFKQITRSCTTSYKINNEETIYSLSKDLLEAVDMSGKKVRLLGISISNLNQTGKKEVWRQLSFDF